MANSRFEYVREFERENYLLPDTYILVRVDGRSFHRLSRFYNFSKPNDHRALETMTLAALGVFRNVQDIIVAYGDSDEYSFVFDRSTQLFERRESKLVSTVVSTFTAWYLYHFPEQMQRSLDPNHLPTFDGRAVVYPTLKHLRDYLSWRQADCHINNLYNTTFWALVERGKYSPAAAEERLRGTVSSDKNEILFTEFGINYNNEPEVYRKGTVLLRPFKPLEPGISSRQTERRLKSREKTQIRILHCDIIKNDAFWAELQT